MPARKYLPLLIAVILLLGGLFWWFLGRTDPQPPPPSRDLADLGQPPPWEELARYDGVLTRPAFEQALNEVYTLEDWSDYFSLTDEAVSIRASGGESVAVRFAAEGAPEPPERYWRPARELPPAPPGKPLTGLRIAVDPGHIGGDYARIEERWYRIGDGIAVTEGDMTLRTARLLKTRLEALGAVVTLVRTKPEPVTEQRPADLLPFARHRRPSLSDAEQQRFAERLFYRTAEIRARAALVNETIRPDLLLCVHFNAEAWDDPSNPTFSKVNHFHLILHGAYMPGELAHDDERFELLTKVFQQTHPEELAVSREVAGAFTKRTSLLPYRYRSDAPAVRLGPALYARNLLANRLYRCPVVFLEPYVMNNQLVYDRVQAGDYEGERIVAGKPRVSLYREYADAVVTGLADYYRTHRPAPEPAD